MPEIGSWVERTGEQKTTDDHHCGVSEKQIPARLQCRQGHSENSSPRDELAPNQIRQLPISSAPNLDPEGEQM